MPSNLTCLRIFIASPGGLKEEREAFRDEIRQYNEMDAVDRGFYFKPVGWEDTLGGVGRPQRLINEDIEKVDFFLLLLHNRWGSPPDVGDDQPYSSGTEEEYHVALKCHGDTERPMREIVLFFKAVDPVQLSDPGPQLQKVLDFRTKIEREKSHLFHSFDTTARFREILRRHLAAWLRGLGNDFGSDDAAQTMSHPAVPSDSIHDGTDAELPDGLQASEEPLTAEAWKLAGEGRLVEAEVEFAKATVGRNKPEALMDYARFLYQLNRVEQAIVLLERAVESAEAQGNESALSNAFNDLGNVLRRQGALGEAEAMFRKALKIDKRLDRRVSMASVYANLGRVLRTRGDLAEAETMFRKSLEINERLSRPKGTAAAYTDLGIVLQIRGDLAGAEAMFRKSLEIDEGLGDPDGIVTAYINLGVVLQIRGDLAEAEAMFRKSLEINERLGRLEAMASAYGNLGNLLQIRGDLAGAEAMYRKSLEIEERMGRLKGMASDYSNLGIVFARQGDLGGAEMRFRKSLEIGERMGHVEGMARTYVNLGRVLQARGDLDGAEALFRKSLEIMEDLASLEGVCLTYGNLGNLLLVRGDVDGAEQMYYAGLEAARRLGSPSQIEWIEGLLRGVQDDPDEPTAA